VIAKLADDPQIADSAGAFTHSRLSRRPESGLGCPG
jgi:hypothetical protein